MKKEINRFKDSDPKKSIELRKNILKNLGLTINEDFIENVDGIWTGSIIIPEIGLNSNGKGTTKDFCKASAYGELFERLQNMQNIPQWSIANEEAKKFLDVSLFKDESEINIKDILLNLDFIYNDLISLFKLSEENRTPSIEELLGFLRSHTYQSTQQVKAIPYCDILNKEIVNLPTSIVYLLKGTNGMCSGNSPYEALLQGFSEICERFSEFFMYQEKLTPPEIEISYIESNFPYIFNLIKTVEKNCNCKLFVYDCSLGIGIPTVCLLMIDQDSYNYRLQYGAHPLLEIALERCLTELLQGYGNFNNEEKIRCTASFFDNYRAYSGENLDRRVTLGNGPGPNEFFFKTPSWEFIPWPTIENFTNEKGYHFLVDTLSKITDHVFIRDMSILGVPSYDIYIPCIGVYPIPLGWKTLSNYKYFNTIKELPYIENHSFTNETYSRKNLYEDLLKFIENDLNRFHIEDMFYIEKYNFTPDTELLLRVILNKELHNYERAIEILKPFSYKSNFYRSIMLDLFLDTQNFSIEDKNNVIIKFLDNSYVEFLEEFWRPKDYLIKLFKIENSQSLKNGREVSFEEKIEEVSTLLKKMKQAQIENCINQEKLLDL